MKGVVRKLNSKGLANALGINSEHIQHPIPLTTSTNCFLVARMYKEHNSVTKLSVLLVTQNRSGQCVLI